jgi:dynein regulatry complex protein 1
MKKKLATNELVSNVRVGIIARDGVRRMENYKKVEIWSKKLNDEQEKSADINFDIDSQWEKVLKLAAPYELNDVSL